MSRSDRRSVAAGPCRVRAPGDSDAAYYLRILKSAPCEGSPRGSSRRVCDGCFAWMLNVRGVCLNKITARMLAEQRR